MEKITGYSLSRNYFEWVFNNPDKGDAAMTALYFFIIDEFNRSGWKDKIAITSHRCMAAIGCHSYNTYKRALNLLITNGFITLIQKSQNRYTANIVSLSNFDRLNHYVDKSTLSKNDEVKFTISKDDEVNTSTLSVTPSNNDELTETILNNKTIKPNNINNIEEYSSDSVFEDDCLKVEDVEVCDPYKEFTEWIKENAPKVAKMKEPFTEVQYYKLFSEYNADDVYNILEAMHNYEPLLKKSVSAYLTARNWLNRDKKKSNTNSRFSTAQKPTAGKFGSILKSLEGALNMTDVNSGFDKSKYGNMASVIESALMH
ncbi:hypothetical protein SAMN05444405_102303 [Bacteroides luti]|uniref:Uncharacterized protein n=1 Tax=Bacteroides luti TaxID=1297750 RepID=A0A1M4VIX6_9BACE|nr:hypothetical protein [Bacteroides luti]SHE68939.1 hypothetical protein SAMN05444405_102303 [Bacteroides luti]